MPWKDGRRDSVCVCVWKGGRTGGMGMVDGRLWIGRGGRGWWRRRGLLTEGGRLWALGLGTWGLGGTWEEPGTGTDRHQTEMSGQAHFHFQSHLPLSSSAGQLTGFLLWPLSASLLLGTSICCTCTCTCTYNRICNCNSLQPARLHPLPQRHPRMHQRPSPAADLTLPRLLLALPGLPGCCGLRFPATNALGKL